MKMRRTIRNAQKSPYFYRKLLLEIQKKFCNFDTILNAPEFAYLEDFFKDIHSNSKLFKTRRLSGGTDGHGHSKKALSYDDLQHILNKQVGSSDKDVTSSSEDSEDMSETGIRLRKHEEHNRTQINNDIIQHAMNPPKISTKQFLDQLDKSRIKFVNHLYTDSDSMWAKNRHHFYTQVFHQKMPISLIKTERE